MMAKATKANNILCRSRLDANTTMQKWHMQYILLHKEAKSSSGTCNVKMKELDRMHCSLVCECEYA